MSELVELATSIVSQATRRAEITAQNLANVTTPAYKRRVAFQTLIDPSAASNDFIPQVSASIDFRAGKLVETRNPYDMAVAGSGFFAVRFEDRIVYTRQGQFRADEDGRLVNSAGGFLQLVNGGDAVVKTGSFQIRSDGTIFEGGLPIGRVAVFESEDNASMEAREGGFAAGGSALTLSDDARVTQGAYEASNVSTGDEIVVLMEALRRAEAGQRVMNVYDDLMGRAIGVFGEAVR